MGEVGPDDSDASDFDASNRDVAIAPDASLNLAVETAPPTDGPVEAVPSKDGPTADVSARPNYMFVTSTAYPPHLLALATADAHCQSAADSARLPGIYRAWLSTSKVNAIDRIAGARGWIRTDGAPFADTRMDIANDRIFNAPFVNEHGTPLPRGSETVIMTGTTRTGVAHGERTCNDWSTTAGHGEAGYAEWTTESWTAGTTSECTQPTRLYCFGVDNVVTVHPAFAAGKLAFLSDQPFVPGGGLEAADALCAGEGAGVAGGRCFKALLGTTLAYASFRFPPTGDVTWVRLDGIPINAANGAPLGSEPLLAPLNVTSRMNYVGNQYVFLGPEVGDNILSWGTCDDWRNPTSTAVVSIGNASSAWQLFDRNHQPCNTVSPARIICLETECVR